MGDLGIEIADRDPGGPASADAAPRARFPPCDSDAWVTFTIETSESSDTKIPGAVAAGAPVRAAMVRSLVLKTIEKQG